MESELLHTYSQVDPLDNLVLCVRLAVLVAVTLTVPVVLFPVSSAGSSLSFPFFLKLVSAAHRSRSGVAEVRRCVQGVEETGLSQKDQNWQIHCWHPILFTGESRFTLRSCDRCVRDLLHNPGGTSM